MSGKQWFGSYTVWCLFKYLLIQVEIKATSDVCIAMLSCSLVRLPSDSFPAFSLLIRNPLCLVALKIQLLPTEVPFRQQNTIELLLQIICLMWDFHGSQHKLQPINKTTYSYILIMLNNNNNNNKTSFGQWPAYKIMHYMVIFIMVVKRE